MLALSLFAGCLLSSSGSVTAAAPADTPWEIWAGASGGVRSAQLSPTGSGLLAADRQVGRYFRPEVQVGLAAYGGGFQVGSRIRIGTEILYPRAGVVPSLWIAFAHQHESDWANVEKDPVPIALGLSENNVHHRTGAELGLGLSYDLPAVSGQTLPGRLRLRATVMDLLGTGPSLYADLVASIGVRF